MNIYDIARLAGVSTATVSRVLNHSGSVSEASRKKIEAVIAREGFIPNALAHGLITKKSRTVGIICPEIADVNHAYPVAELSRLLRESGLETLLMNTDSNTGSKRAGFTSLINHQVEAAISIGCSCSEEEKEAFHHAAKHIPVFVINGRMEGENIYSILCDEEKAAVEMVRRLSELGCKRILYLYDSETYSGQMKLNGYLTGMSHFTGEAPFYRQIRNIGRSSFFQAVEIVRELLNETDFDAVMAADDSLAIGASKALQEAGKTRVPMIGFNNTILSSCVTPTLSSLDNQMKQQCVFTVQGIKSLLDGQAISPCIRLDAVLIERASLLDFRNKNMK